MVDELHLILQVTDILTENLVTECLDWDKEDDLDGKQGDPQGLHLRKLIQVIRSRGVSFDVWEQQNADGKASGKYDSTSLPGANEKSLLSTLPDKMKSFLHPETSDVVIRVWKEFHLIYKLVNDWAPEENPMDFFNRAKGWTNCVLVNGKAMKELGLLHTCTSWLRTSRDFLSCTDSSKYLLVRGWNKIMTLPAV